MGTSVVKYDVVAKTGERPDGNGGTKANWLNVGRVLENTENGSLSMKLDALPVQGTEWNGWLQFFDPNRNNQGGGGQQAQQGGGGGQQNFQQPQNTQQPAQQNFQQPQNANTNTQQNNQQNNQQQFGNQGGGSPFG